MFKTFFKEARFRNRPHMDFVRSLPCVACLHGPSDPAHLPDTKSSAMGMKSGDYVVPLCREHHSLQHQKGHKWFWRTYMGKSIESAKELANALVVMTGDYERCVKRIMIFRSKP